MTWIKICGITNIEDARQAASIGVDALGFIFAPSLRRVEPEVVKKIILALPKTLLKVGVFVGEESKEVLRIAEYCSLNALQFHGNESPEYCRKFVYPIFKAIHVKDLESLKDMEKYRDVYIILDTYSPSQAGGTGISFPWEIALKAKEKRNFILSGGLTPSNVGEAIKTIKPWGVDVCSGVEVTPGKKDLLKMKEFITTATLREITSYHQQK
ncbi:MAG: phosphoribosylanthranilate isomerase [Deltaproteobacteria bacterium]|nr:phosphoribosylanthranilate isomerase [Deltaproteobacteria bacterium]